MTWRTQRLKQEDGRNEEEEARRPMDRIQKDRETVGRAKRDGKRAGGQGGKKRRVGGPEKIRGFTRKGQNIPRPGFIQPPITGWLWVKSTLSHWPRG